MEPIILSLPRRDVDEAIARKTLPATLVTELHARGWDDVVTHPRLHALVLEMLRTAKGNQMYLPYVERARDYATTHAWYLLAAQQVRNSARVDVTIARVVDPLKVGAYLVRSWSQRRARGHLNRFATDDRYARTLLEGQTVDIGGEPPQLFVLDAHSWQERRVIALHAVRPIGDARRTLIWERVPMLVVDGTLYTTETAPEHARESIAALFEPGNVGLHVTAVLRALYGTTDVEASRWLIGQEKMPSREELEQRRLLRAFTTL